MQKSFIFLLTISCLFKIVSAIDYPFSNVSVSSVYSTWEAKRINDGSISPCWSSDVHTNAQHTESVTLSFSAGVLTTLNCIKIAPRMLNGNALCFPTDFTISYLVGTSWVVARGFTHFTKPTQSDLAAEYLKIPLINPINTNQIRITATVLSDDNSGNYALQFGEIIGSNEADFDELEYVPDVITTSSALWDEANLIDNNIASSWSSIVTDKSNSQMVKFSWSSVKLINFIKLRPRFNLTSLGFPISFKITYFTNTSTSNGPVYNDFPKPTDDDWIIIPLPIGVWTGIQIETTQLGIDDYSNFVFQLAEMKVGYNRFYSQFKYCGNDGYPDRNEIRNVGSESVNREEQIKNFNFDVRGAIINPEYSTNPDNMNIYAPYAVHLGGTNWAIYYGGFEGNSSSNDRIRRVTTTDNFFTFGVKQVVIDRAPVGQGFQHVNNATVFRDTPNDWRMVFTAAVTGNSDNKPTYATSTDGINWTPRSPDSTNLIKMQGFPNWVTANVNGSNVLFKDNGTWYLYFFDRQTRTYIHVATSSDCNQFTYNTSLSKEIEYYFAGDGIRHNGSIMQDIKSFSYGNSKYYMSIYYNEGIGIFTPISNNVTPVADPTNFWAFNSYGAPYNDITVTTAGWVQDGQRIYGILYGARTNEQAHDHRIFARWLQKKVVFETTAGDHRWGDAELANGPDKVNFFLPSNRNVVTGRFLVYDTDGTTLLFRSPLITTRKGDCWEYNPSLK